ncbi:MAG TPA: hypothetical protein VFR12_11355 [Pyrinomonadaceae bacterium]|nr:hypothetical protein [Pyrinomonadaceae bacterium]
MKSFFPTTFILFCLLIGCAIGVSAQTNQNEGPLTNAEVVKLVKAGFKEKTIVLIIASRQANFDLSPDKMIQLKRNGVSENIIVAMLARQDGNDVSIDDSSTSWADEPFSDEKRDSRNGSSKPADGSSTGIFGSSTGSKSSTRSRGGVSGSASGDSELTGSATVRILRPPSEAGGNNTGGSAKLERTKSLTNDSIVEMVEAGFSEGTIIRRIEQSPVDFDLATNKLEELRKKRVSDKVLAAMKAAMGEEK